MRASRTLFSVVLTTTISLSSLALALDGQSNAEYRARREKLATKANGGIVLLFAPMEAQDASELTGFRQDSDFFYLSGWAEPQAALLIASRSPATNTAPGHPYTEILFIPAHNFVAERWTGPKLGPESADAPRITGFDHVEAIDKLRDELARLLPSAREDIYTDVPAFGETSTSIEPLDWLKRADAFPGYASFHDVKPLVASLRLYKDSGELERIRKATSASVTAHLAAMHLVKPGVTEREVSALMQYEWGKRGCERPSYAPIVGSGFNSTVLHYDQDSATMQSGDLVVIDAAGEYSMYASDITRTLPVSGRLTARQREIYDIVLGAQRAAMAAFQSGKSNLRRGDDPDSLYKVALDYMNTHGKDMHGGSLGQYFIHGLGHYVGLNVHDAGDYTVPLGPGMVFTIEPGIYIPEEKLGVRIEDTVYVDQDGKLIDLAVDLPHTADEVERTMAGR